MQIPSALSSHAESNWDKLSQQHVNVKFPCVPESEKLNIICMWGSAYILGNYFVWKPFHNLIPLIWPNSHCPVLLLFRFFSLTLNRFLFVPVSTFARVFPFSSTHFPHNFFLLFFFSQGADVTDPGTETEESLGASDSTQRPADSQTPSCKIQETLSLTQCTCIYPPQTLHMKLDIWLFMMTAEEVICCCLSEGKSCRSGSQNKGQKRHKGCFTFKMNKIIEVILRPYITLEQHLELLVCPVFFGE